RSSRRVFATSTSTLDVSLSPPASPTPPKHPVDEFHSARKLVPLRRASRRHAASSVGPVLFKYAASLRPCLAPPVAPQRRSIALSETHAARRLHPRSARLCLADRAAAGRDRARLGARPAPLLVPRHDAAPFWSGGRRAVRRRRRHGAARGRRLGGTRGGVRRAAVALRHRADAAGAA